jgi:hypothetical protein
VKLSQLIKQPYQSFAGVMLAFSLFGFLFPHRPHPTNGRFQAKLMHPTQAQQDGKDSWYTPPRSPGFHDLFGS